MNRRSIRRNDHDREALNRDVRRALLWHRAGNAVLILTCLAALGWLACRQWPDAVRLLLGL